MNIDLTSLSFEELKDFYHYVGAELHTRLTLKRGLELSQFSIGDRVEFEDSYGETFSGLVERVNKKTLSIKTDIGPGHRVSLGLVRPVEFLFVGVKITDRVLPAS